MSQSFTFDSTKKPVAPQAASPSHQLPGQRPFEVQQKAEAPKEPITPVQREQMARLDAGVMRTLPLQTKAVQLREPSPIKVAQNHIASSQTIIQCVRVRRDGETKEIPDEEFFNSDEYKNNQNSWMKIESEGKVVYVHISELKKFVRLPSENKDKKDEKMEEEKAPQEEFLKSSQKSELESSNSNEIEPSTMVEEIKQPKWETTFTGLVKLVPTKNFTLYISSDKDQPVEAKYSARDLEVRNLQVSEKDRPKTQYVQYQKSHSVAWVLLMRTFNAFNSQPLGKLLTFISTELAYLPTPNFDKIEEDVTNYEKNLNNTKNIIDAWQKPNQKAPMDFWMSFASNVVKNYVLLHQLSIYATFAHGKAIGRGEGDAINNLQNIEDELRNEDIEKIKSSQSQYNDKYSNKINENAGKLIDIFFGTHMQKKGVKWALGFWLRLLLTRFPFAMRFATSKEGFAGKFKSKEIPEKQKSEKEKTVEDLIKELNEYKNWEKIANEHIDAEDLFWIEGINQEETKSSKKEEEESSNNENLVSSSTDQKKEEVKENEKSYESPLITEIIKGAKFQGLDNKYLKSVFIKAGQELEICNRNGYDSTTQTTLSKAKIYKNICTKLNSN